MPNNKVCIITTAHPAFDTRIFQKQAKTLAKAGYDVTLVVQHDKDETIDGINIISLPKPKNRIERMFGLTIRTLYIAMKQKADICHFHDPELLPMGVFLKLATGKKIIYDVHEDYSRAIKTKYWIPRPLREGIAVIVGLIENIFSRFMDGIVTVTDDIEKKINNRKTIQVRNYPKLDFPYEPKRQYEGEKFTAIYVGGLNRLRGIYEMVQVAGLIEKNDFKLRLLGRFDEPGTEDEIRKLEGFKKTDFLGWANTEEVWNNLMDTDIGIVCLHPDERYKVALPVKLFEYMAAGLPVIASNFPLWKEIVEGNKCGITVDPLNPEEIAKAITYLTENPEIRKTMGENGRKAILEKYNWENEGEKLVRLYQKLLSPKGD